MQALVGHAWQVIGRGASSPTGAFAIDAVAPRASGRLTVRVASARAGSRRIVIPVARLVVVRQTVWLSAGGAVVAGRPVSLRVAAMPVRPGRAVSVQELVGGRWVERAVVRQGRRGSSWTSLPASGPGTRTLRAVVKGAAGAGALIGRVRTLTVLDPPAVPVAPVPTGAPMPDAPSQSATPPPSPHPAPSTPPPLPGAAAGATILQIVYAVPADVAPNPALPAAISHEMSLVSDWLAGQTGGRRPEVVRGGDGFSVQVVRLPVTLAALNAAGRGAPAAVERAVDAARPRSSGEKLLIYVAVDAEGICGLTTMSAAIFPMNSCDIVPSSSTRAFPFGATYLTVHEIVHLLGAVASCAPHSDGAGHVDDDPRDVLYSGRRPRDWFNLVLDPGHDDYYATGRTDCPDIARSDYWH